MDTQSIIAFVKPFFYGKPKGVTTFAKKAFPGKSRRDHKLPWSVAPQMKVAVSRRAFNYFSLYGLTVGNFFQYVYPPSVQAFNTPFDAPEDLTQRLKARIPGEPRLKLYQNDIIYPEYFAGLWNTESVLLAVECPAGYKLFGRPGSFEAAKEEINKPLRYQSRFIRTGNSVISDRAFNVTAIAKSSMGASSVLNCSSIGSSPNRLRMTLRPNVAEGALYNVDLRVLARQQQSSPVLGDIESQLAVTQGENINARPRQEIVPRSGLYTSETMRQEVRPDTDDLRAMPLVKDVETTTLFIDDPSDQSFVQGWQKTSVYLTRSDLRYPDARGRPVDVRWYRLSYYKT